MIPLSAVSVSADPNFDNPGHHYGWLKHNAAGHDDATTSSHGAGFRTRPERRNCCLSIAASR